MKVCRECKVEKPLSEFYVHKAMLDGHLNKCKECVKQRVKNKRGEKEREYDKKRSSLPHRVKARKEYAKTEQGVQARKKAELSYRKRYPMKYAAHILFRNAVRDGKVARQVFCSECNSTVKIEAHHDDYSKPFEVRWLCECCHKEWHRHNKPIY